MIRKAFFWLLLIAFVGAWLLYDRIVPAEPVFVKTAQVKDGDTLILNGKAYRLDGIDAPEYHQACQDSAGRDWACGKAARLQLATFAEGGSITCQPGGEDRYGRAMATCSSATAPDLGEAMIVAGYAVSPTRYQSQQDGARAAKRGIWQGKFTDPAEWREQHPRKDAS